MRRFAIAGLVFLFVLVGVATVWLSTVTDEDRPANATVTSFEPRVAVGNESGDAFEGSDGVVTCNEQGPMPGNAGLVGEIAVERPSSDGGPATASFRVTVTVGDGALVETRTVSLSPGESERATLLTVAEQPASLRGSDSVIVRARVTTENATVATATRTVRVVERDVPCADEREN